MRRELMIFRLCFLRMLLFFLLFKFLFFEKRIIFEKYWFEVRDDILKLRFLKLFLGDMLIVKGIRDTSTFM